MVRVTDGLWALVRVDAATSRGLNGISTSQPRRRRDSSLRNTRAAPAIALARDSRLFPRPPPRSVATSPSSRRRPAPPSRGSGGRSKPRRRAGRRRPRIRRRRRARSQRRRLGSVEVSRGAGPEAVQIKPAEADALEAHDVVADGRERAADLAVPALCQDDSQRRIASLFNLAGPRRRRRRFARSLLRRLDDDARREALHVGVVYIPLDVDDVRLLYFISRLEQRVRRRAVVG